eukprot:TRINITY_DN2568_c0_g2_i2.p1 TRINITY_DN2568_c0_g2~~TRINITY_DN2568_c0_g2_i2.p1  ORF type:complete len:191 (+),score=11.92 TRINITY_DN2568_c0_g2_i2:240-812(+)
MLEARLSQPVDWWVGERRCPTRGGRPACGLRRTPFGKGSTFTMADAAAAGAPAGGGAHSGGAGPAPAGGDQCGEAPAGGPHDGHGAAAVGGLPAMEPIPVGGPCPVDGYYHISNLLGLMDAVPWTHDDDMVSAASVNRHRAYSRLQGAQWGDLRGLQHVFDFAPDEHVGESMCEVHGDANYGNQGAPRSK